MELPISSQSYQPTTEALLRAHQRAQVILARMVGDEVELDGATLFANSRRATLPLANFAADVRVDQSIDAAKNIFEIHKHFAAAGTKCHYLDSPDGRWHEALANEIRKAGSTPQEWHLLARAAAKNSHAAATGASSKADPHTEKTSDLQIVPARAMYAILPAFFEMMARHESHADAPATARAWIDQLDESRLELFVGLLHSQIVAVGGVLSLGNIGVLWPTFADPAQRGKGLGKTITQYVLDHCHRSLFESVIIARHETCPAVHFYESLGFSRVATLVRYVA